MKYGTLVRIPEGSDIADVCCKKFGELKECGFDSCQLVYKPKAYKETDADLIRSAADEFGIEISAQFCGYYDYNSLWDVRHDRRLSGINSLLFGGERIKYVSSAIPFMQRLGITDMIIHAGFVPDDPYAPEYATMLAAVVLLGKKLKSKGMNLLFETGCETPVTLLRLIKESGLDNLYINLDTANLLLYGTGNPVDAVYTFGQYVRNMHAKDGLPPTDPEKLGQETPIGSGFVDFDKVFKLLKEKGYDRFITVECELGGSKTENIVKAMGYLKTKWESLT